ncbi:hypothetical protein P153DRAFT_429555 [Dothidotthia symphoricarpi CBS 119687]|uniref:Uncharacterized protein n=1 Tax=Dothidotthia symphoricarpi CBS 119687 TaxID=1392245 RepID=A0A6A6AMV6_9PLEO|nr:uncharacterized protein P153DRAFT_429555 [Dothidotthia symphoricarpi CBS 119687]KAF2132415.1 hypothetical protein P153DRAFT_429555 [Dothidotthia symphoricarpi CBS 119687]
MSTQDQPLGSGQKTENSMCEIGSVDQKSSANSSDMTTLYHFPQALELSASRFRERTRDTTAPPNPGTLGPTKTLHEQGDDQPAITLTTYNSASSPSEPLNAGGLANEPDATNKDSPEGNKTQVSNQCITDIRTSAEDEGPELVRLRCELDDYWMGLQLEFEEKTGRVWVPLRGWGREEWVWGGDDDVEVDGDEDGVFDWLDEGVEV